MRNAKYQSLTPENAGSTRKALDAARAVLDLCAFDELFKDFAKSGQELDSALLAVVARVIDRETR